MKRFLLLLALVPSLALAAPHADGTVRQTADSWTGDADAFDTPGRDQLLRLPNVLKDLKIGRGSKVADVGAGGGWLSVRLARAVWTNGVVYAEEILPKYTNSIQARVHRERLNNVRTVLGTTSDPKLPANTLDAAMILNAYHEFDQPLGMLAKIKAAMKPGARLGIIERDNPDLRREAQQAYARTGQILHRLGEVNDNNPLTDDHRLARDIVRREGEKAGLHFVSSRQLGEDNYLAVFQK